jgi:hypothetical protein
MFYDIRKKEGVYPENGRTQEKYFALAKKFILMLPYPVVLFLENTLEINEFIKEILEFRQQIGQRHNTQIIRINLEHTYFFKYYDTLIHLQTIYAIHNGNLKHETPLYTILNNNKFFFMEKAIQINPFESTHFVWIDFGINHVALNTEQINTWIHQIPDKIKQLCINPYLENTPPKEFFHNIYHHTAGGLFSGSKKYILQYVDFFKQKVQQIYDEEWYQMDEAIMTLVQREHPEIFDFYYGDYTGIVSNYLEPFHNIELIYTNIQKALNYQNILLADRMVKYTAPFFQRNPEHNHIIHYKTHTKTNKELLHHCYDTEIIPLADTSPLYP